MMRVSGYDAKVERLAVAQGTVPDSVTHWVRERRLSALHAAGYIGRGVKVLVIDTGVDSGHPYLAGNLVAVRNFTPDDGGNPDNVTDRHGHGCHVSGIVRAGAPGIALYMAKGLADDGYGEWDWLAAAIRWGIEQGVHMINASWGDQVEPTDDVLHSAIRDAVAAGILFGASAGNSYHERLELTTVGWPARWQEPLAAAATQTLVADNLYPNFNAGYSSAGPEVDLAAPGTFADSCAPGGGYVTMSGTSMALPMALAEMACLYEQWHTMTGRFPTEPEAVTLALMHTRDILPAGRDVLSGVGEIDACPLVKRRRVTLFDGSANIRVETADGDGEPAQTAVTLDVPAEITPDNRFLAPFRGLANALGASEVTWDAKRPAEGVAVIETLDMGPTINRG